ncbi:Pentatricopeptide repeat-containing protein [Heracleum sosnowskyi]|uniref:Pentatricopeptide repeat-containing protein n=1 Tax=Heracleum sosnowskyi TaxID=360622 RepID=A0AAD8HUJ0_9APIA|nr:Pentatricopeptide repeat-containing protein [Heracleum sosnowskyi]
MVSVSKKLNITKLPSLSPKTHFTTQPFIPFSQLQQQRKHLETDLVSKLDNCRSFTRIKRVHAQIILNGLDQCCYVVTKLLRMLSNVGVPVNSYAHNVFDRVSHRNSFIWTALIRGYCVQGPVNEAVRLYSLMRMEGIGPVSFTFSALLKACSVCEDVGLGMQIHGQIVSVGGFGCDLFVANTMIDMYVKCGFLECGRRVFDEMVVRDVISWTSLIVAYVKSGDLSSAAELFDGLPVKDMVAWTAMVNGYAQNARPREALNLFKRMQDGDVETDEVTLVGVISACAQLGAAKYASWVRKVAEESGYRPTSNVVVGSAFVDMYAKCGNVEEAYRIFERMSVRNVYSYSSMIVGFAMHGHASEAINLFEEMVKTEIKPNRVTFVGVLTACSHAGLAEQGERYFATMQSCYGVVPDADHYACMVDLRGRSGRLEGALQLIKSMPVKPHGGVWGALLGACRIHADPDIAEIAAKSLFELEPDSIGNYILLSNIYASAGRWEDVARVRKTVRMKGLKKNPACSFVEGKDGVIHEFLAGDLTHPRSSQIKQELENLLEKLKFLGYQPVLSSVPYDVDDKEKMRILMAHSEKLAFSYGLLTVASGSSITIVKNLRICEDCHLFMCGASWVTGRKIIIRDNMRFHHFHDGACSCNNFW